MGWGMPISAGMEQFIVNAIMLKITMGAAALATTLLVHIVLPYVLMVSKEEISRPSHHCSRGGVLCSGI